MLKGGIKVFFSTIKQEQLPNEVPLVLWKGTQGAVHSHLWRQQSKCPGRRRGQRNRAAPWISTLLPTGSKRQKEFNWYLAFVCVWFSLCLSLPFVLLKWTFVYLAKGSGEYQFYFWFPFAPSVQRLSKRVWQPKHPARWRASSGFRSQFP